MHVIAACGKELRCRGRLLRVCELAAPWYEEIEDPEALIRELRESAAGADLLTFFQRVPEVAPRYAYHFEPYGVAVIKATDYADWWNNGIKKRARYLVKKAGSQGIAIRVVDFDDEYAKGISEIYNETPIRQGRKFPHYRDSLEKIRREYTTYPGRNVYLGAYLGSELVGFARIVFEERFADVLQLLAKISHREKGVANALMARIVDVCCARNAGYIVYGDWDAGGLLDFKRHNGFSRMDLPRYFIPLTWRGALALRLGLHRGLRKVLPEGSLQTLRALRRKWLEMRVS